MKQFLFLAAMTLAFSVKAISEPFWAVFLYYLWAVLRPQFIWEWALSTVPINGRWSLVAAVVALAALVLNVGSLRRPVVQRGFLPLVVGFGLCLLGSYAVARNEEIAGRAGWEYAKILIMLVISAFAVNQPRHFRYLGWAVFLALVYIVYQVNSLYVFEGRLDIQTHGFGGTDNNGAALMIAMVIPFCFFFFHAERRVWRWGFLACMVSAAHAVMLTFSRGAMVASIIASIGMIATTRKHRLQTLGAAAVLGMVVLALAGKEVRARFLTIEKTDADASAQSRYASWDAGLRIAKDYPIFGAGIRNSNLLTHTYGADMEGRTVHNLLIQMAADSGFPCVAIYVGLLFCSLFWAWQGAKMLRDHKTDEQRWHHNICLACFWSLTVFFIGSMFLSVEHFETPYLLMFLCAVSLNLAKATQLAAPALIEPANDRRRERACA